MGITYLEGVVTGPTGKQATVRLLVDTGATYTLLPAEESRLIECLCVTRRQVYLNGAILGMNERR